MIQVAWYPQAAMWTGGLNYFRNLARATALLPDPRIELVLLGTYDKGDFWRTYRQIPYLPPPRYSCAWLRKIFDRLFLQKNCLLESLLKQNNVDLLSHYVPFGKRASLSALCWIPDLQHKRMPHFFPMKERLLRDRAFQYMATHAQGIIFSSENAKKDFMNSYALVSAKLYVLPFVAYVNQGISEYDIQNTLAKYNIDEPYFHVPNQLWKHKNHKIILEALKLFMYGQKKIPLVISTGDTEDYRNPEYYQELLDKVRDANLLDRFRFLGRIPFENLGLIMRKSLAILNPSYFEGWSTSVEEAKSIGKTVILSDIAVHKEQAPDRGIFFHPDKPQELYEAMEHVLLTYDASVELKEAEKATQDLSGRMMDYASLYENIVLDVLN